MSKYLMGDKLPQWKSGIAQTITFVITQQCNLRCKYCYMVDKNNDNVMTFDTGEHAIDYFLNNADLFIADAVILEFIGGEPLLEIELIDHLTDYFKIKAYEYDHKWFTLYRISISTNGLLYSSDKVQKYIKKNMTKLSIGITLDGTKEKNDSQRVYPDGRGTYDDILKNIKLWQKQFPGATTKVTIGHEDLHFVKDSIIHLWELGMDTVPANVVFEDVWEEGDDEIFYEQLKELADYIIDNHLWENYNTSLFTQGIGHPLTDEELNKNSCGTGVMIAVDAEGTLYPCIRFMGYSLNEKEPYITGNIYDGINLEKIRPFYSLNVKNQSDEKCLECNVAGGCQWCTGYNYDKSDKTGTVFQRNKSICKLHKARVRANNYLWSRLSREKGVVLKRNQTLLNNLFILLADNSVSFCNYNTNINEKNSLSIDNLKRAAKFCFDNFYNAVIVHSNNNDLSVKANEIFTGLPCTHIYLQNDDNNNYCSNDIIFHDSKSIELQTEKKKCCILQIEENELSELNSYTKKALKYFERVNINLKYNPQTLNSNLYFEQLCNLAQELLDYFINDKIRQVNLITDELLSKKRVNCDFGNSNFVLAPNGLFYNCPAEYYDNPNSYIGSIIEGKINNNSKILNIENNPICSQCSIKHCRFCLNWNKKITGEYNVSSSMQCKIAQLEKNSTFYFYNLLKENCLLKEYMNVIKEVSVEDPIIKQNSFSRSFVNY